MAAVSPWAHVEAEEDALSSELDRRLDVVIDDRARHRDPRKWLAAGPQTNSSSFLLSHFFERNHQKVVYNIPRMHIPPDISISYRIIPFTFSTFCCCTYSFFCYPNAFRVPE